MEASKRRRSMLDCRIQQLTKDEVQDVSSDEEIKAEENKADAEVAEKQARNEQPVSLFKAMPKRAWSKKDQQRTDEMLKMIDNLLLERRIMQSLESLVGGRNIETDKRLLLRTVNGRLRYIRLKVDCVMCEDVSVCLDVCEMRLILKCDAVVGVLIRCGSWLQFYPLCCLRFKLLQGMVDSLYSDSFVRYAASESWFMTEFEPFKDPVETETPESPHTVASLTSIPDSTPPTCHAEESEDSNTSGMRSTSSDFTVPLLPDHPLTHTSPTLVLFLRRTARMAVRVLRVMSPGLSASIAEVAAMSDLAFCKRFRSSYETSPSSSPPDLSLRKRSPGTSELVDDNEEADEEEEDEEVEESLDSNKESEDAKDEGPTAKNDGPTIGDEGLAMGDKGPNIRVKSLGLRGDEAVPEGDSVEGGLDAQYIRDQKDGRAYIDVPAYPPPAPPVQTPPSPEWSSGSLPISPAPSTVSSPISSPMILLTVPLSVASPATAEAEGFLTELGA
ncbi:hypothetical protein Tco_1362330 [Tanacetum coccineum]